MRTWCLPERARALIFDLDSTLYTHPAYAAFQNSVLIERLAAERGESRELLEARLRELREEGRRLRGGDSSLGELFLALGIPVETSVRWREELIRPADWLEPDPLLDACLARLASSLPLCLVTNNPRSVGRASLEALGVLGRFSLVIGLDDSGRSKPDPASFILALRGLGLPGSDVISIGDRYDVDLAPALSLGMGGILVEAVQEVLELPAILGL